MVSTLKQECTHYYIPEVHMVSSLVYETTRYTRLLHTKPHNGISYSQLLTVDTAFSLSGSLYIYSSSVALPFSLCLLLDVV